MDAPFRDLAFYREKAAHCRRFAEIIYDDRLRDELLLYAEEFDEKAEWAEQQAE